MKWLAAALATAALTVAVLAPSAAGVEFGFKDLDMRFAKEDGTPSMQAGSHPYVQTTTINPSVNGVVPAGQPKDLRIELPPGFVGSPDAAPKCDTADFTHLTTYAGGAALLPDCPDGAAVGLALVRGQQGNKEAELATPIYNLTPPPGAAARLGFSVILVGSVTVDVRLSESPPYNIIVTSSNITQLKRFYGIDVMLWSNPGNPVHDPDRGLCGAELEFELKRHDLGDFLGIQCPASIPALPFFTLPRSCTGPLLTSFEAFSWEGEHATGEALTHGPFGEPLGVGGCERLGLAPRIASEPTARSASSPTGLDFDLDIHDEGLTNVNGTADSDIKKAVVTLPEGVTINPSQAEGLEVCSEAELARERSDSSFGAGCPAASKIGSVEVQTPLLQGALLRGSVFVATPENPDTATPENPFGTLIALYMTIKEPERGINIVLAGKVEPDPRSGRLVATFDDLPQAPFSHFHFHFREGGRSPLTTPPLCGTYVTEASFTPWANPAVPVQSTAAFVIDHGVGGGPCPPPGTPPFEPDFTAGTLSNDAGGYAPFHMGLTRRDGDQDLTRFSATLPLGMLARLAGVARCPEDQIALAKTRSGRSELAGPSCPAASEIGQVSAGAGVGAQLVHVPGKVYLAGPYNGAPLSVVAIVPAVAGPFDVGTVVTRQALVVNPRSAEVNVDGERSDPIPHILAGIPLVVRDIRVEIDRPRFTLNPTSCDPDQVAARIWGGGADPFSDADDAPIERQARFQAAGCRGLGFKPRLGLRLRGGTGRGAHPRLRGIYRPRPKDANLQRLVLRLPHSAFLDQAHIRTICTRVQFRAERCPRGAIYGHVKAFTPLLEEPLKGPAYLRSSNNNLPDLVFDLHGLVDFEAVARIDSIRGGIRATFTKLPDAPLNKVIVNMQGGRKGLIINSTNLCARAHRASARSVAHSGARRTLRPLLRPNCTKKRRKNARRRER